MQITKKQFQSVCKVFDNLIPHGEDFIDLPKEQQDMIVDACVSLIEVMKKNKQTNGKTYAKIKAERESNPNYARPKREYRRKG